MYTISDKDVLKKIKFFLDDGRKIPFDPNINEYDIPLPAGHPRIPRLMTETQEHTAEIQLYQAFFSATSDFAEAFAEIRLGASTYRYTVRFYKDPAMGFCLQYDDRYPFPHEKNVQYISSHPEIVAVDENGVLHALSTSAVPVKIIAEKNSQVIDTLTISGIVPAQLNLFFTVGQSNAAGNYDSGVDAEAELKKCICPDPGTVYCMEARYHDERRKIYDLSCGRYGFMAPLGRKWYELTGEKVLMVQAAIGGAPLESWLKNGDLYGGFNLYDNAANTYYELKNRFAGPDSNFEIIRTGCFWCHGETAQVWDWNGTDWDSESNNKMTADTYCSLFRQMYASFRDDFDISFFSMLLVRALPDVSSEENRHSGYMTEMVSPRISQYSLHNEMGASVFIGSRIGDIARPLTSPDTESPGYGFTGPENVHYTQTGYNAIGFSLAENAFAHLSGTTNRIPVSMEVIAADGRTRLQNGSTIQITPGTVYPVTAVNLPLFAIHKKISYSVISGSEICSIDSLGRITFNVHAKTGATADILIENENGMRCRITAQFSKR